ncbi:hypothetical protein MJT46_003413 [Ovis ammon polii x Ovis aries]|nr:hypothetical protein MJT46_003413 [Ovis ammon polii x Ovis aries]
MELEPGGAAAALLRQKRAALRRRGCSFESPSTALQPPGPLMDPLTKGPCGNQMTQTLMWKAKSSLSFGIQPLQTWPTKDPEVEAQVNLSSYLSLIQTVEFKLISSDADGAIQRAGRFRVENGSSDENATALPGTWRRTDVHLENPEYHTRWYFKYFLGQVHQNYIGNDAEKSPFFLSVTLSDQNNQRVPQYRAILWRKTGTQKICLPYSPTKTLSVKSILSFHRASKHEIGSDAFQKFLNLLGDTITLKGWTGYRGGLDTKNDTTGIHSVYTIYQGHEIMFHVSTMLPYSKENKQQVERKRHIGNDIVTIVFQEGEEPSPAFKPSMIRSHFTLINGEKATLETPTFAQKRRRTLDMLIRSLYQDLMPDVHKNMLNRRSFSDVLPESPKSARKKEEARQAEFVRIGQVGFLLTPVVQDTELEVIEILRKSFVGQEEEELVCGRVCRRSPRLSAVQRGIEGKQAMKGKCDCRENKLEKTKGCHLYAINTHHSRELRIVVAIRNKLLLITRKHNKPSGVTGMSLLSPLSESPVEEFQYIREICLSDSPAVMTLVDGPTEESDNLICVAYRHQFDVVNESTGEAFRLHHVEASRVNFVAAIDVYEDGEAGLLLCYNFCAFPYLLAFTTDSMEIRLVVNGNLVHTAVVPQLQLVASRSDIYFTATASANEVSSGGSSKGASAHNSPQTPPGRDTPVFPSSLGEGEIQSKNLYKIPLRNLVGRSIERPLKSPLVSKVITPPTSIGIGIAAIPVTHSLSLSRMEIKEIASRTRRELLGLSDDGGSRSEGAPKPKSKARKRLEENQGGPKPGTVRSTSSDRITSSSLESPSTSEANPNGRYQSTSSDPDPVAEQEGSPVWGSCPFQLTAFSDEDIIDLK